MAEYNEGATNGNRLLDTSDDPTAKDNGGVLEASEVSIGSVPSELSIDSYEIRKTLEAQNFDLGTESEVARDIFDRSADVNQDGSEAQQMSRWAPPSFSFHSPLPLFLLSLSSPSPSLFHSPPPSFSLSPSLPHSCSLTCSKE